MKKVIFAGLFLTLMVPFTSFAAFDSNLKYGASGSSVTELQEFLTAQGVYSGPITGHFYSLTLAGVKAYQNKAGITPVSGYFGPLSRAKASANIADDVSASNTDEQSQTGTITPPVVTPAPVVDSQTQTQINALTTQVQNLTSTIQAQSQVQSQIQNNTQQIATNTTPIQPVVVTTPVINYDLQIGTYKGGNTDINDTNYFVSEDIDQSIGSRIINSSGLSFRILENGTPSGDPNLNGDLLKITSSDAVNFPERDINLVNVFLKPITLTDKNGTQTQSMIYEIDSGYTPKTIIDSEIVSVTISMPALNIVKNINVVVTKNLTGTAQ